MIMASLRNTIWVASSILLSFSYAMPQPTPPPVSLPSPICTDGPLNALPDPPINLPASCLTKGDDLERNTKGVKGPSCFTQTVQAPSSTCPQIHCASPEPDQICPLYLKVSSTTVPCETDCCPATPTATYACGPCPTCDPCRIPTIFTTFTTGCPGGGTQSSVTTITPPPYF